MSGNETFILRNLLNVLAYYFITRLRGIIAYPYKIPIGNPKIIDYNPLSAVIKGIYCERDGEESMRNLRRNLDF